jgi:FlaA1/EpsC-like NDP-sugar epimerase
MHPVFEGKRVLITGGTGSLGKTLVRRILSGDLGTPEKLIVFSRDEAKQHEMRLSYMHKHYSTDEIIYDNFRQTIEFRIADIRDYADVCNALRNVDTVINAAALKQVPVCEYFPLQAIMTNCIGASNIVRAISENGYGVDTVLGVSTDKATNPVNAMGMTKALQERILISANVLNSCTDFICVRYGNVLASRGSVIPLFHDQIINGGPVTITHHEMTRFFMSLDKAADTVFKAIEEARPGETYVPRVSSARIESVARALIEDRDVKIEYSGVRPGEKMHEILISEEEIHHTVERGDYYVIRPMLPELRADNEIFKAVLEKEYSSADNLMDFNETVTFLQDNKLMIGNLDPVNGEETLR